ncbi:Gp138 family membrane-puncturing spike protein [Paraburkholderia sp. BR10936]|uniref:Gp138 family membrane-puncturing spike protein n=1 Tax=Paraburkholderia sp. BR10936 TaxID=3236993 RepID=UPI0034D2D7C4
MNHGNYPFEQGGFERAQDTASNALSLALRVAMPGRIDFFDPDSQTATVQPMLAQLLADGTSEAYPALPDVPVYCMRGGPYCVTMPVKPGDDCLLVFADRCIDAWFSKGEALPPADYRLHDLSDAYALVGVSPRPKAIPGYKPDSAELRSVDGAQAVTLDPDGTVTNRNSAGSTVLTPAGGFVINAPAGITLNGNTLLVGDLSSTPGNGGSGQAALANRLTALDITTPNVASHDRHSHNDPQGGNVGYPF